MYKIPFDLSSTGMNAVLYRNESQNDDCFIYMLGPNTEGILVDMGVKYLNKLQIDALVMAPHNDKKGFYDIEINDFRIAVNKIKELAYKRIGICGGSATAMLALIVASYLEDISICVAMSPCDFVMEGYYRDNLDGASERPADNHSFVTVNKEALAYLPFAYRHPEYWNKIQEESKNSKNIIATRKMFNLSEAMHPLNENEMIKVEKINGKIVLIGARDDCLWDTCRYIERMEERLKINHREEHLIKLVYNHGTHFLFPESMIKDKLHLISYLIPIVFYEGRHHLKEAKAARVDFDLRLQEILKDWKNNGPSFS